MVLGSEHFKQKIAAQLNRRIGKLENWKKVGIENQMNLNEIMVNNDKQWSLNPLIYKYFYLHSRSDKNRVI
jgi:hypothetical protein